MKRMYTGVLAMLLAFSFCCEPVLAVSVTNPKTTAEGTPDAATVSNAVAEFKSLSRKERKLRMKEVKKKVREYKAAKKAGKQVSDNTLLLVILAILLPPLAVYLHEGAITNRFWISVLLTLLFWLPGVIYALIVVLE
ncbi:MAG TPA: YqaE/Pmp3 family membrane protein [Chitinophagaceae bacterium]